MRAFICALALAACGKSAPPPSTGSATAPIVPVVADAAAMAMTADAMGSAGSAGSGSAGMTAMPPAGMVAVGDGELDMIDADGKSTKTLAKIRGTNPRWTRDHSAILMLADDTHEVHRITLDGSDTVIAKLPASVASCNGKKVDITDLRPQSDLDFALDSTGTKLCIDLLDHHINVATQDVAFTVDVASGSATSQVDLAPGCPAPKDESTDCHGQLDNGGSTVASTTAMGSGSGSGMSGMSVGSAKLGPGDYYEESVSPSGKWSLVSGNAKPEGHADLLLLEKATGNLYAIPQTATAWPTPIGKDDMGKLNTFEGKTYGASIETEVYWTGKDDLLVIGNSLITPGVKVVAIPGDLAR